MSTLHTYGDSHATHYGAWDKIKINGLSIETNHLPGKLMYSFGRDEMMVVTHNTNSDDYVCFCFGEIDCRCHIHKYKDNWKENIDNIVKSYFVNIEKNVSNKNLNVLVFNVVPPLERERPDNLWIEKGNSLPSLGTDEDRKKYTLYMNDKLKEYCEMYNYTYFDVYDKYVNEKGYIKEDLADGNCHISNPKYMIDFLENHLK